MRKEQQQMVGARLPAELLRELELIEQVEQSDRSTTVRKLLQTAINNWKLEHFAQQYKDGKMSMARSAREAGVSLWQMFDYLRQKRIPVQYDMSDWEEDVATVSRRVKLS